MDMDSNTLYTQLLSLFFVIGVTITINAQDNHPHKCGFEHSLQELQHQYPEEFHSEHQFERWIEDKIEYRRQNPSRTLTGVLELPVVVHVIHNGEPIGTGANISASQIYSQLNVMNEDFRREPGTNGSNSHPEGADSEIEFCLAQIDPNGNPTDGINRVDLGVSDWDRITFESVAKPATQWNPDEYLNIWVPETLGETSPGFILLGYAQFPTGSGLAGLPAGGAANTDGVVIISPKFGSVSDDDGTFNTWSNSYGRTAVHEVGHWLGLRHIWGDSDCSVDDYCADTPRSDGPNYGCSAENSCDDTQYGMPNNPSDMVENYMDYSNDLCMSTFTNDQKERMRTVLEFSPRRSTLLNVDKCSGAPIVAFSASQREICPGTSVEFSDESLSNPISWSWSFPGGVPSTSTAQNPVITYPNVGSYNVTLEATNAVGSTAITKNAVVIVDNNSFSSTLYRDFDFGFTDWNVINPDGGITWELKDVGGIDGNISKAASIQNRYHAAIGERDALESPIFSLYGQDDAYLKLKYAYRKRSSMPSDSLIIYVSTDGGSTYPHRVFAGADDDSGNFSTHTNTSSNFVPTFSIYWCFEGTYGNDCLDLDLSQFGGMSNLRLKIENYNNNNNNIYIKDVSIEASCFIVSNQNVASLDGNISLFPNPNSGQFTLQFDDWNEGNPRVQMFDILGRNVMDTEYQVSGTATEQVNVENLTTGTYFVRISVGNRSIYKKMIVQ